MAAPSLFVLMTKEPDGPISNAILQEEVNSTRNAFLAGHNKWHFAFLVYALYSPPIELDSASNIFFSNVALVWKHGENQK